MENARDLKEYIFTFKHPDTGNSCPNTSATQTTTFIAVSLSSAQILAENERIICVNGYCGVDYKLKR